MKEEEERTPLRTILQNFLNHIEKLDREKLEGSYDKEFQELKLFSEFLKTSKQYSCSQGEKEVNRKKNRYKDILPFDCSRVILEDYAGIPGSDYINANYIKGASGSPAYIASQGPLPHTVNDFWRMVVQCEVQVIVMACNEEESGKHKCENYWVENEGEEKQFGMVAIQLIKASVVCPDFLVRTMRLKYTKNHSSTQEERTVCQFHYSAWPDHGVPPLVRPLLDMVRLVRDTQASETLPVLVHCSAGCGRTGTICAIDYVWGLLRAGKLTKDFSLFKLVREMRKQRIAMVQTKEQYVLVHHAVKELFNEQLRMIDSHPYENIDVNGMVKESPEPVYATINFDSNNEEKQDSNEKECASQDSDDAPPLPCKRKPYTAHTKQEKEVENLTEKHRCNLSEQLPVNDCSSPGTSSSNSSTCGSILHKPRIAKLRALFERTSSRDTKSAQVKHRTSQQVTRSHSLGAVRKLEEGVMCVQPIPSRGVLRVPQLSGTNETTYVRAGRPALPIKRSKSLKVLSSGERNKLSMPTVQGGNSQECQYQVGANIEVTGLISDTKFSSSVVSKSLVSEVKPFVPPKKVIKDRISDKKVSKSIASGSKSSQCVASSSKESSEDMLLVKSQLSANDSWRRSLDSLTLETNTPVLHTLPSDTLVVSVKNCKPYMLDDEAKKLLQDCRDYLRASAKCESSKILPNSERNCQDSQNLDSLQHLTVEAQRKVNAVVGGLGTRERRNSFRQAISKELESSGKSQEFDTHRPNKSLFNACSSVKSTIHDPRGGGKPFNEVSQSRMKVFMKPGIQNSSGQLHTVLSRSYQPKPRTGLRVETTGFQHTGIASSRVSCTVQMKSPTCTSHVNPNEGAVIESRWVSQVDGPTNTDPRAHESVYLKGNLEETICRQQDKRLIAPNNYLHANKSHKSPCHAGHLRSPGHTRGQDDVRIAHNPPPVNREICGYKNVNVSVARKLSTAPTGKFMTSNANSTKHFIGPNVNESDSSDLIWLSCSDVPVYPQTLVVNNEELYMSSVVNEPNSINHRAVNGNRKIKTSEFHIPSSKMKAKGEADNSICVKHGVTNSRSKERAENCVSSSAAHVKQTEWGEQVAAGDVQSQAVVKPAWSPAQVVHSQERRFQNMKEAEQSASPGIVASNVEWDMRRGGPPNAERGPMPGRVDPKLSVKQKKEHLPNEVAAPLHHGSRDDLALCANGSGSGSSSGSSGSSRVRRHASVVLLRHSLIDNSESTPLVPLTLWKQPELGESSADTIVQSSPNKQNVSRQEIEAWNVAPGVDVDMVGASIKPSRDHGTALTRALEAFHIRKPSRGSAVSPPQQRKFPEAQQVFVKKQHYL